MPAPDPTGPTDVTAAPVASSLRDFPAFFRAELPRLAGYCARLLQDREAGADLAQEALTRTFARWVTVREPRAYAYLVATNLVRAAWRSEVQGRAALTALVPAASTTAAPADVSLRDLVERLPERLRVPTLLHYFADLPIAEIARITRRPAGTVRQRLHEARVRLGQDVEESDRV